ncbi:hypothetical protein M9Y10_042714 [Tritrichomonas musculus]|uniref:Serpin domain-containing protein n=1 Tax=Tritrichomonas musculus TaxID=1915356 RepID=A0ABR2JXL9_9EUKA
MASLVDSLNKFGFETLQKTNTDSDIENTVFSPYSAFVCVAMSTSLFKNETRAEILKSLQIDCNNSENEILLKKLGELITNENTDKVSSSNRIWANQVLNFDPSTFAPNEKILGIAIEKVGFPQPGCNKINEEVNRTTKGMIPKLVEESDVGPDTAIVLLNAIYFKSDWQKKFDIDPSSHDPQNMNFTLANGTKTHVNMLESLDRRLPYAEDDKFQVVSIPYLNNEYEFIIIVPKDSTASGYKDLKELTYERLNNNLLSNLRSTKLDVKLPKFTIELKTNLNGVFNSLGMNRIFTNQAECTDPNVPYFVSSIIQKAKIILDENGTEAAAATGMIMMCCALVMEPPKPQVFADHPFAYLLRNARTNSILFEGFVKNPTE